MTLLAPLPKRSETFSLPLQNNSYAARTPLNDKNWKLIAAKLYDNPQCVGIEEFEQDLKRLKYIKKAITRYRTTGELCERLIINHLIVLVNVFGPSFTSRLVFLKMGDALPYIKPFLVMLSVLPDVLVAVGKDAKDVNTDEIPLDPGIVAILRKLI